MVVIKKIQVVEKYRSGCERQWATGCSHRNLWQHCRCFDVFCCWSTREVETFELPQQLDLREVDVVGGDAWSGHSLGGDRSIANEDSRRPCEDASRRLVLFHRTAAPMADRNACKCGARPRRACAGATAHGDLDRVTK